MFTKSAFAVGPTGTHTAKIISGSTVYPMSCTSIATNCQSQKAFPRLRLRGGSLLTPDSDGSTTTVCLIRDVQAMLFPLTLFQTGNLLIADTVLTQLRSSYGQKPSSWCIDTSETKTRLGIQSRSALDLWLALSSTHQSHSVVYRKEYSTSIRVRFRFVRFLR